jgi:hypothetical protein
MAEPSGETRDHSLLGEGTLASPAHDALAPRLAALFWLAVLVLHLIGAGLWWWLQPGGFPLSHPRFWVNRVAPLVVVVWAAASLEALHHGRFSRLALWLPAWMGFWYGLALGGFVAFPVTLGRAWIVPLALGLVLGLSLLAFGPRTVPRRRAGQLVAAGWFAVGFLCVLAQRPGESSTAPLLGSAEVVAEGPQGRLDPGSAAAGWRDGVMVNAADASVTVRSAGLTVFVDPLLRFQSRSPDGCWTVFVLEKLREGREPRLISTWEDAAEGSFWAYQITGQGPARLRMKHDPETRRTEFEALSHLDRQIFSHLNSFCDLEVRGHQRLFLEFSPCPGAKVEVRRFDYPIGRPAQFAYVDADRRFRVVEAASGEKGPFRTLAEGRLEPRDPLAITLHDEVRPAARVTLHDWAAQAGTALSPTAGWGVPVNAIEFSLSGEAPSSPASIFVSLAATSVGRGWDCVGHRAGTYRNRITIEPAPAPGP